MIIILENDMVVNAAIQAVKLAIAIVFRGHIVMTHFHLKPVKDLSRVLMNGPRTEDV